MSIWERFLEKIRRLGFDLQGEELQILEDRAPEGIDGRRFAAGGIVKGSGSDDRIPVMLQPCEGLPYQEAKSYLSDLLAQRVAANGSQYIIEVAPITLKAGAISPETQAKMDEIIKGWKLDPKRRGDNLVVTVGTESRFIQGKPRFDQFRFNPDDQTPELVQIKRYIELNIQKAIARKLDVWVAVAQGEMRGVHHIIPSDLDIENGEWTLEAWHIGLDRMINIPQHIIFVWSRSQAEAQHIYDAVSGAATGNTEALLDAAAALEELKREQGHGI